MSPRGQGYGSEDLLRRVLASAPGLISSQLAAAAHVDAATIKWLPFPVTETGAEREFAGVAFLDEASLEMIRDDWLAFWPARGRKQSWDAIGQSGETWLLLEAKANHPEFCSPGTRATDTSRKQIEKAMNSVKRKLAVHRYFSWTDSYYQYANRLAMLSFLREREIDARLVFVYFTGDEFPDGTPCPKSRTQWESLIEARRLTLGLSPEHALSAFEHDLFISTELIPSSEELELKAPRERQDSDKELDVAEPAILERFD